MNKRELEFKMQIERNLLQDINEFNNNECYCKIRELYKLHFSQIAHLIERFGAKQSIEDISKINSHLTDMIYDNFHLLRQINSAISSGKLIANGIK